MKQLVSESFETHNFDLPGFHHIGHSTHWICLDSIKILTDPWLLEPAQWTLSHRVLPLHFPRNPDLVLISHHHEDHFDIEALKKINRGATYIVPSQKIFRALKRIDVTDIRLVEPGVTYEAKGCKIEVVLGKHDVYELCYRIERNHQSFFFAADSMLTPEITTFASKKKVDLAILPGERSSWFGFRFVMTPEESIHLAQRFSAKQAVLTHHDSFVSKKWPVGWSIRVPEVKFSEFPSWFHVPKPGDYLPFPMLKEANGLA